MHVIYNYARRCLKRILPKDATKYCGGLTPGAEFFVGRLLEENLSKNATEAISDYLILPNGVRKTTKQGRNAGPLREVLDSGLLKPECPLRVLDIGASFGLDASTNHTIISERFEVSKYELGDMQHELLYDEAQRAVFDYKGRVIQAVHDGNLVSFYFEYKRWYMRPLNVIKWAQTLLLRHRYRYVAGKTKLLRLVDPALRVGDPESPFCSRKMDVFSRIEEKFDLIICFHLLTPRYFSAHARNLAIANLEGALNNNGVLIVGETNDYSVTHRDATDEWTRYRRNDII